MPMPTNSMSRVSPLHPRRRKCSHDAWAGRHAQPVDERSVAGEVDVMDAETDVLGVRLGRKRDDRESAAHASRGRPPSSRPRIVSALPRMPRNLEPSRRACKLAGDQSVRRHTSKLVAIDFPRSSGAGPRRFGRSTWEASGSRSRSRLRRARFGVADQERDRARYAVCIRDLPVDEPRLHVSRDDEAGRPVPLTGSAETAMPPLGGEPVRRPRNQNNRSRRSRRNQTLNARVGDEVLEIGRPVVAAEHDIDSRSRLAGRGKDIARLRGGGHAARPGPEYVFPRSARLSLSIFNWTPVSSTSSPTRLCSRLIPSGPPGHDSDSGAAVLVRRLGAASLLAPSSPPLCNLDRLLASRG